MRFLIAALLLVCAVSADAQPTAGTVTKGVSVELIQVLTRPTPAAPPPAPTPFTSSLTITSGTTTSSAVTATAYRLMIVAPEVLDAGTYTVEISTGGGPFGALQVAGSDVELFAGKALIFVARPFVSVRIVASGAVSTDRVFSFTGR